MTVTPIRPLAGALTLLLSTTVVVAAGSYDLRFEGDGSFNGAHGGQAIEAALVRSDSGKVVATRSGTVSAREDPAFSFTFADALQTDTAYEVHYWIDSNFGGGSAGTCDPKGTDHQWRVDFGRVDGDLSHTAAHNPAVTTDVCGTFHGM